MSTSEATSYYRIGTPGKAWGEPERAEWSAQAVASRSYKEEVLDKLDAFKGRFDVEQYGALSVDTDRYPLFYVKSREWVDGKKTVLITGGVHGYETSGVQGALLFIDTEMEQYASDFNVVVCPCVSPWGYERIQRWNNNAEDPNRGFYPDSSRDECKALMALVETLGGKGAFYVHVDLHETTDSDESEFRPAKSARDGEATHEVGGIPDGFYLVANAGPGAADDQDAWDKAMIDAVSGVTHIAPPDDNGEIIGLKVTQDGVVGIPTAELFLCASVTDAKYATTTEVYPDSPKATDEQCNRAQVACVTAALDYINSKEE